MKQQRTIKELCKQQFPCEPSTENRPTCGICPLKKGSSTVLFLFSQVGSCISASHLRCQPSHMIVCLVKAYEHCHLVVISKAPNYTKLHLRKCHYVTMVASESVFHSCSKHLYFICRWMCGHQISGLNNVILVPGY